MIHLGELLASEEKSSQPSQISNGIKKSIKNFDDHKQILYLKALANEADPGTLQKQQAEEKRKIIDERLLRNFLTNLSEEEIKYSKINKLKLLSDWRVIMRIAKIDDTRKLLELYYQNFERELDNKDAILQMLDRDIEEAEEHYNIALNNHFIHIRQLTSLQDSRVKGLFQEFAKDVDELDLEFTREMQEIEENFREEQGEINRMRTMIQREYDLKIEEVRRELTDLSNSQVQKINEIYSRIQDNIKKIGIQDNGKFSNEMSEIRQKAEEKNKHDKDNIGLLNELEKQIAFKKKKVDRHNEELKQWKIKIKQNNEDWELKNDALKKEKEKIMESYKFLKKKLIAFRNNQREKLKKLVKNSWDCITKLKEYIKLAEKILKLAEICRRLETERVRKRVINKKYYFQFLPC
jgi:dynein regulatory complex subunit 2